MTSDGKMAVEAAPNEAFEAAVNANIGRLLALARAMLGSGMRDAHQAEDLVQDALLNLFRHRREYDWSDGGWALMAKAVTRRVISCRRRKVGQSLDGDPALYESLGTDNDPAEGPITAETAAYLRRQMEALPDPWREVLVLREQQNFSYRQIAETLRVTEAQVKTWLFRSRARLAQAWREHTEGEQREAPPMAKGHQGQFP